MSTRRSREKSYVSTRRRKAKDPAASAWRYQRLVLVQQLEREFGPPTPENHAARLERLKELELLREQWLEAKSEPE